MKKSISITRFGGPEVFKLKEDPGTSPLGEYEVRIEVSASGVNFADVMMRMGLYPEAPKPPFTPGYEVAGRIIEIGKKVSRVKLGDRVMAGCRFGGYTNEITLSEGAVYSVPASLSDQEAASIPVNFMTAWIALQELARVRKGDRVLIQSSAGGVGIAAIQIAKLAGAQVVGTLGSDKKSAVVRELGASETILNSDWENSDDSKFGQFDIILDPSGGESLKRSFRRLHSLGRVVSFGLSNAVGPKKSFSKIASTLLHTPLYTPFKLMNENKGVYGVNLLKLFTPEHQGKLESIMHSILRHFENGEYRAIVGKTFPLAEAGAAQDYLQGRSNIGKVVLDCRA